MMKTNPADNNAQLPEASGKKPRLALAFATAFGVGYLPKAPGTMGSLVGCGVTLLSVWLWLPVFSSRFMPAGCQYLLRQFGRLLSFGEADRWWSLCLYLLPFVTIASLGVWSASQTASYSRTKDPQHVVIDEVSGQQLTFLLGLSPIFIPRNDIGQMDFSFYPFPVAQSLLRWKCLLLGFILFRVFDIWKPWPIRRLEKLPGGWGVMADDWMAGVYAAILLRVALHFNFL
jgi:phosphatidylglycerophosphatase A